MDVNWLQLLLAIFHIAYFGRVDTLACDSSEMQCRNGACISVTWKCDGEDDCGDNSDEDACSKKVCGSTEFACKNGRCIPQAWTCDKADDCGDNSDESATEGPACSIPTCAPTDFQCNLTKVCLKEVLRCDGRRDCGSNDNSDEEGCEQQCGLDEFKCGNGDCISRSYQCDGYSDCGDSTDEMGCEKIKCPYAYQFRCGYRGRCIYRSWVCNGIRNCMDGSDETDELCKPTCKATEFKCDNSKCIDAKFRCNRVAECGDNSDEKSCNLTPCQRSHFKCNVSGHCIEGHLRCDGSRDCLDGSDEVNCPTTTKAHTTPTDSTSSKAKSTTPKPCPFNHFKCKKNGKCIHSSWLCDGEADCVDGEDESKELCDKRTCSPSQFACKNGKCILSHFKCDSIDHCGDNSDEEKCGTLKPTRCTATTFTCGASGTCIEQSLVCDGTPNCPNSEDEPASCGKNECQLGNHGCTHNCTDLKIGYKCSCMKGYHLHADNKTCINTNECHEHGMCSQKCIDLKGSYKCLCFDGYYLDGDMKTCRASGPLPQLMIAMRSDIRQLQVDGQHYKTVVHTRFIKAAMSLDVDIQNKMLYLADLGNHSIVKASLDNADKVEHIIKNVQKPEGLAFDWIAGNIYWSSTHPKYQGAIEVAKSDGSSRSVLVHTKVDEPRAVAVHPLKRLLFWTDWGKHPRIECVSMDGLQRQVVIDSSHLTWPNGLTIDFSSDRIFWTDSKRNNIGSSNLDGSHIVIVASDIHNPYGITVFEDSVYWTNYKGGQIFRANKFTGSNKREYQDGFFAPMDLQIVHPLLQKIAINPCAVNNGGCTHLCLLSSVKPDGYSCACPTDVKLYPDGRHCDIVYPTATVAFTTDRKDLVTPTISTSVKATRNSKMSTSATMKVISTVKPDLTTKPSDSKQATRNTWMQTPTKKMLSTVKPDLSTKPSDSKQGCQDTEFYCQSSRKCISKSKLCNGYSDCPNNEDEELDRCNSVDLVASSRKDTKPSRTPLIAGIVAGIAFLVLVVVVVVLIILKRKKNNSNLSITFQQGDEELMAVKFNSIGTHRKNISKNFDNINYLPANETEVLITDPCLMNVPDDSSSDNGSTCDETKPVMKHQDSSSGNSLEC